MKPARVVIKKYGNRRLYDTTASRYVNLEEIAAMVRNGTDVQVVEAKSGEDLTRVTLTQIIVEDAKGQPSGLPLELLRQLIITSDHVGQEFIMWYLKSAFDAYRKVQTTIQGKFSEVQDAALSPLAMVKKFVQGTPDPKPASELEQLRRRLAELESRTRPAKKKAARKRKARATS